MCVLFDVFLSAHLHGRYGVSLVSTDEEDSLNNVYYSLHDHCVSMSGGFSTHPINSLERESLFLASGHHSFNIPQGVASSLKPAPFRSRSRSNRRKVIGAISGAGAGGGA